MRGILIFAVLVLTGCSSLTNSGISEFTANPATGEMHWVSGKEYATMTANASRTADGGMTVNVSETGVKAPSGAASATTTLFNAAWQAAFPK